MGYFTAENSSLGQSYLCEQYENGSFDLKRCFFIFHKQFRDDSQFYLSIIEGVILNVLSLLIVPANVVALYNFFKKRLTPDLKLLVTMLCIYNFAMAIVGVVNGISRFSLDFPLGYWGCGILFIIGGNINTCTAYTMTWLSIERRKAICSLNFVKSKQTVSNQIKIVALTIIFYFITWSALSFYVIQQFHYHSYEMPNGVQSHVCVIKPNFKGMVAIGAALFSVTTFFIPLTIALFNFGYFLFFFFLM